jgi:hypothetical protein
VPILPGVAVAQSSAAMRVMVIGHRNAMERSIKLGNAGLSDLLVRLLVIERSPSFIDLAADLDREAEFNAD